MPCNPFGELFFKNLFSPLHPYNECFATCRGENISTESLPVISKGAVTLDIQHAKLSSIHANAGDWKRKIHAKKVSISLCSTVQVW